MEYGGVYPVTDGPPGSKNYIVKIGSDNVPIELTDCPIRFQAWINEKIIKGGTEDTVVGLVVKTKTLRTKRKALVCSFFTEKTCFILKLERNSKVLLKAISEFLFTPRFKFVGLDTQTLLDALHIDGEPDIFDVNKEAARKYKKSSLLLANLNVLLMHTVKDFAHYPGVVDDQHDRQPLEDGQVAAIAIDGHSVVQIRRAILGPDVAQSPNYLKLDI